MSWTRRTGWESAGMNDRLRAKLPTSVHVPFALVAAVGLFGLMWIALRHWRIGSSLIGLALLLAAVLRLVLPSEQVGLLAIRSRGVDLLLYSCLGLMILAVALTIQS